MDEPFQQAEYRYRQGLNLYKQNQWLERDNTKDEWFYWQDNHCLELLYHRSSQCSGGSCAAID